MPPGAFGNGVLDASLSLPWAPLLAGDAPVVAAAVRAAVARLLGRLAADAAGLNREMNAARGTPKCAAALAPYILGARGTRRYVERWTQREREREREEEREGGREGGR